MSKTDAEKTGNPSVMEMVFKLSHKLYLGRYTGRVGNFSRKQNFFIESFTQSRPLTALKIFLIQLIVFFFRNIHLDVIILWIGRGTFNENIPIITLDTI
jgi:hypothetical protein